MTDRQKVFCDEYLVDFNAYQAAIRAGYKTITAKDASKWINENENPKKPDKKSKYKPELKAYIDEQLGKISSEKIANATEVMEYLTGVMRGTQKDVVVQNGVEIVTDPSVSNRLKAAELIGKRYALFTEKQEVAVLESTWFKDG